MATKDKRIDQLPAVTILSLDSLLVLQQNGQAMCMTAKQLLDYIQNNVNVGNAVKFISQSLSATQKQQARTNIGAAATGDIPSSVVLYTSQSLTDDQKAQARTNIGAAAPGEGGGNGTVEGAVLYSGSQSLSTSQKQQARTNIGAAASGDIPTSVVKYTSQSLSTSQKQQARANIGAAAYGDIPTGVVLYTAQSLTDAQKQQARKNIGVSENGSSTPTYDSIKLRSPDGNVMLELSCDNSGKLKQTVFENL